MAAIESFEVSRVHPGGRGVFDVTLALAPGEVVGLLGPNGSGKTTLLSVLGTLRPATGGRIRWFGEGDRRSPSIRRRLGVALDTPAHFDELTGYQNAWFFARQFGLDRAEAAARLAGLFEWAGLREARDQPVREYSLGMKRRLGLIEALAHRPQALVLDEPTLALDHRAELDLIGTLEGLRGEGRAILIATNDVHLAERVCDRVLFLHRGRIVREGPLGEVIAEVAGARELELEVLSPIDLDRLRELPGVEAADATGGRVRILVGPGAGAAQVLAALNGESDLVREMRVRRPDLGDAFLKVTGATLGAGRREEL
ncbi:MAG: ATP-binding cassette domain-containing protein [Candidatus Dormibacteraceae bacterium]